MIMCFPVCNLPISLLFHFLLLQGFLFLVYIYFPKVTSLSVQYWIDNSVFCCLNYMAMSKHVWKMRVDSTELRCCTGPRVQNFIMVLWTAVIFRTLNLCPFFEKSLTFDI